MGAKAHRIFAPSQKPTIGWSVTNLAGPLTDASMPRYAREWWEATDAALRFSDTLSPKDLAASFDAAKEA